MASSADFVEFICDQIAPAGFVRFKKMFGEYMVYLKDKPIFLICNDTVFVSINDVTTAILGEDAEQAFPYNGSKLKYIVVEVDDQDMMVKLASELEKVTPFPKNKKR